MIAIIRVLSRTFYVKSEESDAAPAKVAADIFKTIALFSGFGLLVSLCAAAYGLDLSAGFFKQQFGERTAQQRFLRKNVSIRGADGPSLIRLAKVSAR